MPFSFEAATTVPRRGTHRRISAVIADRRKFRVVPNHATTRVYFPASYVYGLSWIPRGCCVHSWHPSPCIFFAYTLSPSAPSGILAPQPTSKKYSFPYELTSNDGSSEGQVIYSYSQPRLAVSANIPMSRYMRLSHTYSIPHERLAPRPILHVVRVLSTTNMLHFRKRTTAPMRAHVIDAILF